MDPSPDPSAESRSLPSASECPFCHRSRTELMSAFGSQASVATYWCRSCRSPFEVFKWRAGEAPGSPGSSEEEETREPGEER